MSISQIQKLLDERNLDLQALSEQTELSEKTIQDFEQNIQKSFDELHKISNALNMDPVDLLRISLDSNISVDSNVEEHMEEQSFSIEGIGAQHPNDENHRLSRTPTKMFCETFPKLCK